jgi:hypothetical protein
MAVNGAVAAENNHHVHITRRRGQAFGPLRVANTLELFHEFRNISRPKNGGSAHETEVLSELPVRVTRDAASLIKKALSS